MKMKQYKDMIIYVYECKHKKYEHKNKYNKYK